MRKELNVHLDEALKRATDWDKLAKEYGVFLAKNMVFEEDLNVHVDEGYEALEALIPGLNSSTALPNEGKLKVSLRQAARSTLASPRRPPAYLAIGPSPRPSPPHNRPAPLFPRNPARSSPRSPFAPRLPLLAPPPLTRPASSHSTPRSRTRCWRS